MAPSIGTFEFLSLRGVVDPPGQTVEDITPPYLDGVELRLAGERHPQFELVSIVDCEDPSGSGSGGGQTVQQWMDSYKLAIGEIVVVIDDRGELYENVAVLGVRAESAQPIAGAVGGTIASPASLLTCRWTLQVMEAAVGS